MSFLFPLYFLGLLALAVPLYLHLKKRPPSETVEFSSLRFLKPTRNLRVNRRAKLEHLTLLALRCLALLLLASLFARPFMKGPEAIPAAEGKQIALLIDTSASMQRSDLWEQALERARDEIDQLDANDQLALFTFDHQVNTLLEFPREEESDSAAASAKTTSIQTESAQAVLDNLKPSWFPTDLGTALLSAAEALDDQGPGEKNIRLISDFQAGSTLDALRQYEWPTSVRLHPIVLEAESENNASLLPLKNNPNRARLQNDPHSNTTDFTIGSRSITLAPGTSTIIHIPANTNRLALAGDDHPFDNVLHLAPSQPIPLTIAVLGDLSSEAETSINPAFYLRRAFPTTDTLRPTLIPWDAPQPRDLTFILRPPTEDEARAIRRQLLEGALMFYALPKLADDQDGQSHPLSILLNHPVDIHEASGHDYALLEDIDFEHPALSAFADPTLRDFTNIHVWRHRALANLPESAHLIARFDTGAPAWLEFKFNEGRLLLWTTSWHPDDSPFARSSKFIPLLYSFLLQTGTQPQSRPFITTGDSLPAFAHLKAPQWHHEKWATANQETIATHPGHYTVRDDKTGQQFIVAANLPASESNLAPLPLSQLENLGVLHSTSPDPKPQAIAHSPDKEDALAQEANQNWWQTLALILFILLIGETFLAQRTRFAEEVVRPQ